MFFSKKIKSIEEKLNHIRDLEKKLNNLNLAIDTRLSNIHEEKKASLKIISQKSKALDEESKRLKELEKGVHKIVSEKSQGFPWLAEALSEYIRLEDFKAADYFDNKSHPAPKKAERLREISIENKALRKQLKVAQQFVKYYENLFPWIKDYVGENLDEVLKSIIDSYNKKNIESEDSEDPVFKWVPEAKNNEAISISERNQKALERYLSSRNKNSYEVGRDYERYIGYLYERKGYQVEYFGIEQGIEDLGRDLICTKDNMIEIVQCKYWASHKTIHEKHINQLYGTAVKYYIDHKNEVKQKSSLSLFPDLIFSGQIKATFITSTKVSETAKKFSSALGVQLLENKPLEKYPLIKCNINTKGEKIYHLPFDQQYDKKHRRVLCINCFRSRRKWI